MQHFTNYKHENRVSKFLASVNVPPSFLYYDNLVEYSNAKQLLKTDLLNAQDRKILDLFTRHWVIKHDTIDQARLEDIRSRLNHYNQKQTRQNSNANQKELRLARQRKKLLDKFKQA